MHDRQASSVCRVIGERDRRRLVVILQHRGIVLHFVDEGQLNSVAFELDGDAHFAAGIPTRDVSTTTSNTASRITRPCRGDRHTGRLGKPEPCTPAEKVRSLSTSPSATGASKTPLATFGCANRARSSAPTCTFDRLQS